MSSIRKSLNHNNDNANDSHHSPTLIFNQSGRGFKGHTKRGLNSMEMQSVVTHVLINYLKVGHILSKCFMLLNYVNINTKD